MVRRDLIEYATFVLHDETDGATISFERVASRYSDQSKGNGNAHEIIAGSSAPRLLGVAVMASLLASERFGAAAFGQAKPPSRYDVFDIGDIPADPSWHSFRYTAFAINESNAVAGFVGMRIPGYGDRDHAIFWTPVAKHGFAAFVLYDLTMLAGLSALTCPDGSCDGYGFDMNDADILVGSQRTENFSFQRGFVWALPTNDDPGGLQTFALDSLLATPTDGGSEIHGISDANPPILVGEATDEYPGGIFCTQIEVAFRATFSGTPGPLTRLDSNDESSVAYDINETATARAAGQARTTCGTVGGCAVDDDAQRWVVAGAIEALPEGAFDDTISRAINNSAQACGDSGEIAELACPPRALFWESNGALTVIGDPAVTPDLGPDQRTQAFGISPASEGLVNVVGANVDLDIAYLWHRTSAGAWHGYDLNVRVLPNCPLENLNIAHDINGGGWIVGRGTDCLGRVRGFVLRPAVCPADLDNDCQVGASDLAVLLGQWGDTPGRNDAGTIFDLDQDQLVAASDLALLLGSWGGCPQACLPCESGCVLAAVNGEGDMFATVEEVLVLGLLAHGFESVEALNAWSVLANPTEVDLVLNSLVVYLKSANPAPNGGES